MERNERTVWLAGWISSNKWKADRRSEKYKNCDTLKLFREKAKER